MKLLYLELNSALLLSIINIFNTIKTQPEIWNGNLTSIYISNFAWAICTKKGKHTRHIDNLSNSSASLENYAFTEVNRHNGMHPL